MKILKNAMTERKEPLVNVQKTQQNSTTQTPTKTLPQHLPQPRMKMADVCNSQNWVMGKNKK